MPCFYIAIFALIIPIKLISFTVHNYLTKRDYSYSTDDICDLSLAICIIIWIVKWYESQNIEHPGFEFVVTA